MKIYFMLRINYILQIKRVLKFGQFVRAKCLHPYSSIKLDAKSRV